MKDDLETGLSVHHSDGTIVAHTLFADMGFSGVELIGSSHAHVTQNKVLRFGQEVASGNGVEVAGYEWLHDPADGVLDPSAPPSLNTSIVGNELAWGRHNHASVSDLPPIPPST